MAPDVGLRRDEEVYHRLSRAQELYAVLDAAAQAAGRERRRPEPGRAQGEEVGVRGLLQL